MVPLFATRLTMRHLVYFMLTLIIHSTCCGKDFHLGILAPWGKPFPIGTHSAGAIEIALEAIKTNKITFYEINKTGHNFQYTWVDTQCNPSKAIPDVAQLIYSLSFKNQMDAFIGPWCSSVCEPVGYMAREKHIPVVSFGCDLQRFSDKLLFPTFARTYGGPGQRRGPAFVNLMQEFDFQRVSLCYGPEALMISTITSIRDQLIKHHVTVTDYLPLIRGDFRKVDNSLRDLKAASDRSRGMVYSTQLLRY